MEIQNFKIGGLQLITPPTFFDERGFFMERFHLKKFEALGLPTHFVQDNFSRSKPKVLRGLHYQFGPPQGKLVTCVSGRIFDVAVDIRADSPTLGEHVAVELTGDKPQWFWIPAGFAHGFCVLGDEEADVLYKVDNLYGKDGEDGIAWNDPKLNIQWPVANPIVSSKDQVLQSFSQYKIQPKF